jgi:RimJ/RimL family protein N-acetyltransferase
VFELGVTVFSSGDRRRGVGTEAVGLITRHLFDSGEAHRVELTTDVDNDAMRVVAERVGFVLEGVLRCYMPTPAGRRDYALYAITRGDWENVKERWTQTS